MSNSMRKAFKMPNFIYSVVDHPKDHRPDHLKGNHPLSDSSEIKQLFDILRNKSINNRKNIIDHMRKYGSNLHRY